VQEHCLDDCREKRESKVFEDALMCLDVFGFDWMCLGEKLKREERKNLPKNYPKLFLSFFSFFLQNEGYGVIYTGKMTIRLPAYLAGPSATLLTSAISAFSWFNLRHVFKGLGLS